MMGLETTVNFISDLNPLNPTDGDLVKDGDNHIRLIKAALKQTFPNITGAVTATQGDLNTGSPFPSGGIILWSGSIATIPSGWWLCDGTNGTPNLRDRFVVGAGSTYTVGAIGGAATVTLAEANLPAHSHSFSGTTTDRSAGHTHTGGTDTNGAHVHTYVDVASQGQGFSNGRFYSSGGLEFANRPDTTDGGGAHSHSVWTNGESNGHTHNYSGTTSSVGSGTAHENLPPYFALAYIMKA
jgi:microcystin-dependent protein